MHFVWLCNCPINTQWLMFDAVLILGRCLVPFEKSNGRMQKVDAAGKPEIFLREMLTCLDYIDHG